MAVWEEALDEAVLAVRAGALPWRIESRAVTILRNDHFRSGFREAYATKPGNWTRFGPKVLRMAKCAGMLAGLMAEWKKGNPAKQKVTMVHLLAAMAMVRPGCPPPKKRLGKGWSGPVEGLPCRRVIITEPARRYLNERIAEFETKPLVKAPARRRRRAKRP